MTVELRTTGFQAGKNSVSFESEGVTLKGNLFLPEGYQEGKQYPAVIVTGSWTTVKETDGGYLRPASGGEGLRDARF